VDVLIEAEELAGRLADDADARRVVVLDVRWALGGPPGRELHRDGHIPGAVYVDLDTELARHGPATEGRHPLPSLDALGRAARRWGIREDTALVVAYDGGGNLAAARAWWLLRWAGLTNVRLLDGALPAWVAAGRPLERGEVVLPPGDVRLRADALATLGLDDVRAFAGVLLDARAGERFRGEVEPVDPKRGHIPGAVSAPTTDNLDPATGRFLPADALRERFAALGVEADSGDRDADAAPVAVYCGSGVTAAHEIAALALAGIDAALYPGSWSQWSNHDLPVATGE
jgi:thiosulfate/3-mercaptopyruvate sulfurtransferase